MRLLLAALVLLAAPVNDAAAQPPPEPDWREQAVEREVLLRPYAFEPRVIRLPAGRPVHLRLVNQGQAPHSFHAPAFFRSARLRDEDGDAIAHGRILLGAGETRSLALVPAPGRYRVRSFNLVQRLLGMSALIIVE
jgi:plastocyanin